MQIIYEPHPVSAERKAELREQGYKIIDAIFAPKEVDPQPASKKRQKQKGAKNAD